MGKEDVQSLKDNNEITWELSEKKLTALKKREELVEPFEEYKSEDSMQE